VRVRWLLASALTLAALLPAIAPAQPAPAEAPPDAPSLDATPPARLPVLPPQVALPTSVMGLRSLPQGGWRLGFEPGADTPSALQHLGVVGLGGVLARETTGRVTLWAEVAGGDDVSTTRRLALRRALAVRAALVAGGLPETRVDIRALGRTEAGRDVVDILPFGATRD
jgi:hypothetical protein